MTEPVFAAEAVADVDDADGRYLHPEGGGLRGRPDRAA